MEPTTTRPLKLTVVGDGAVGKTSFLVTYTTDIFPTEYVPTVFDNYSDKVTVEGQIYNLTLWDTAGQEEYERLRILSYPNTDVFLVCYAVDNPTSFSNLMTKWIPEVRHYCPRAPIVLAGLKVDCRETGDNQHYVPRSEGVRRRKKIGAAAFIECSAQNGENLHLVIEECIRAATQKKAKRPVTCSIL